MTFQQFQTTGLDVADLRHCNNPDIVDAFSLCNEAVTGRVYYDGLHVSRHDDGQWNCLIANVELSDRDLTKVERFLYDWALSEGYFENGHDCSDDNDGSRADPASGYYPSELARERS